MALLKGTDLRKTFGTGHSRVEAIRGVSVELHAGEVVMFMGPSGSGKTTLLSLVGALLHPDAGRVEVAGRDITNLTQSQRTRIRRRHVGFVFQNFQLLSNLNAVENVEVAFNLLGMRGEWARERSLELLDLVGMRGQARRLPRELSGGEKQRVGLARALAGQPVAVLADEPTANLDAANGHRVIELLAHLAKEQRKGVLLVSHDPRIIDVADRIYELEDGRIKRKLVRDPSLEPQKPLRRWTFPGQPSAYVERRL